MNRLTRRAIFASPAILKGQSRRPNILWLMTDEQRPDSMGIYGKPWAYSPRLDDLARQGVFFSHAYTPAPVCVACRCSLLTGQAASTNRVLHNQARLSPDAQYLTQRFADAGYRTASFGKSHYFPRPGHLAFQTEGGMITEKIVEPESYNPRFRHEDFDVLQYAPLPTHKEQRRWILAGKFPVEENQSAEARNTELAIDWLNRHDSAKPFFLRLSFNAPHTPAVAPEKYLPLIEPARIQLPIPSESQLSHQPDRERLCLRPFQGVQRLSETEIKKARHYYYARCAFADAMMGRLIDHLKTKGLLENTIVAFVSDHGSHLGDQGLLQKQTFYEEVGTVPYFFFAPNLIREPRRVDTPVTILGLLPTLLDLAGLPHSGVQAQSLAPLLRESRPVGDLPVFSEIAFGYQGYRDADRQVMVRHGDWKLTIFPDGGNPDPALYNLRDDPQEMDNLARRHGEKSRVAQLRAEIARWDRIRNWSPS
jgi:arylsulfatase A-like enzyme